MSDECSKNIVCGSISKSTWIELCKKYNKWCFFEEVKDCTYEQAEMYIKNMPTLEPQ